MSQPKSFHPSSVGGDLAACGAHVVGRQLLTALLLVVALWGCRASRPDPRFQPQENFLQILSEFKRHQNRDLYRFPAPRDLSGQNVQISTIVRLDYFRELYPGKYPVIANFIRAEAYERLGDYAEARRYYLSVARAPLADGDWEPAQRLQPKAQERAALLERFIRLGANDNQVRNSEGWVGHFEACAAAWRELATSPALCSQPYLGLAWIELENTERLVAETLWRFRDDLENGAARAIGRLERVIDDHPQSARLDDHHLQLGRWQAQLAHDYVRQHPPDRAQFRAEFFDRRIGLARERFRKVEARYSSRYRAEARGELEALEAFAHRIRDAAQ